LLTWKEQPNIALQDNELQGHFESRGY